MKTIPAIPVIIKEDGRTELGAIAHLDADARFELVGDGFNARTIRVRCEGRYYVVFQEDLETLHRVISESPLSLEFGSATRIPALFWSVAEILVNSNESNVRNLPRAEVNRGKTS